MARRIKRYSNKEKRKRKLKYKNILLFLGIVFVIVFGIIYTLQLPISNIYISNNQYLTDQEIIEYSELCDYPPNYKVWAFLLKRKLKKLPLIKEVKITKKMFTQIYIEVMENRPLFYDSTKEKTILLDGNTIEKKFDIPYVINYIPDTVFSLFHEQMVLISPDILDRISEIKYDPNEVDEKRFLLYMKDGNYVYVTLQIDSETLLSKFININNYLDIVKKFGNKKGILYLDDGEYFKILN